MRVVPRRKHLHPDAGRPAIDGRFNPGPFINSETFSGLLVEAALSTIDRNEAAIHTLNSRLNRAIDTIHRLKKLAGQTCIGCKYEDEWNRDLCASCPYNNGNNWTCKEEEV